MQSRYFLAFIVSILSIGSMNLHAAPHCGELKIAGGYGPFDYTNAEHKLDKLPVVEAHHFTPNIEKLRHGNSGPLGAELAYTLHAFPNHHRALSAMSKLALRDKTLKPEGSSRSVLCFFDRAIRFKPDDGMARMLYGDYLLKSGQPNDAAEQLRIAAALEPENPNINYNLGLLYMQKKDYEQARAYAKKAYDLGFPLPGLKNQLMRAGKWED
ncbi:MAG: tetratricopeptide repeat protein [Nitrosospira sp.]|nr:tetratricopeptide repeat protein [Nitrosospira sp.]